MKRIILFFSLTFLLAACGTDAYYDKSFTFAGHKWEQKVKPSFVVDFKDTSKLYDFVLTLRTTEDYKYSNIWIFLNSKPPVGESVREPYEIKTTYPDGNWIGKKTGSLVEHQLISKRRKLPFKGKYTFTVEQGITQKSVDEIMDISFRVEEVK